LKFDERAHTVSYRWKVEEKDFAMPVRVGQKDHWEMIYPATMEWKTLSSQLGQDEFQVDTDYYYVGVESQ
jgi:hypothetical protein